MPNYIWTAKNKFGRNVVRVVTTETSEEAKSVLIEEGCTELSLKQDEIGDVVTSAMEDKSGYSAQELQADAEERLKYRGKPPATFTRAIREGIGNSAGMLGFAVLLAICMYWRGDRLAPVMLLVVLATIGLIISSIYIRLPGIYYRQLYTADDWHRWPEVFALVSKLEKMSRHKIPASALGRHRAKAMAATGHISEALAGYAQYEGQPGCPRWMYLAFVGSIYDSAKQYGQGIECNLKALGEKPSPALQLDLAKRYLRYQKDTVSARAALAEADKSPITDTAVPYRMRCLGELAWLEGDDATARKEFESALEIMERTRHLPYRDGAISTTRAHLCLVLARQGDLAGAKRNFEQARAYLVATEEKELLAECRRVIGSK